MTMEMAKMNGLALLKAGLLTAVNGYILYVTSEVVSLYVISILEDFVHRQHCGHIFYLCTCHDPDRNKST